MNSVGRFDCENRSDWLSGLSFFEANRELAIPERKSIEHLCRRARLQAMNPHQGIRVIVPPSPSRPATL